MIRVFPETIEWLARSVDSDGAEAVFVSCGAVRVIVVVDQLETPLNELVICSIQAMAKGALRKAGINDSKSGYDH